MARYMESGPEEDIFRTMGLGMHGLASISQALARRRHDEAEQKRQAASEARRAAQVERQFKMQQQELKARIGEREYNRKMDLYNQVARLTETYMRQNRDVPEDEATRHVIEAMKQAGFDVSGITAPPPPEAARPAQVPTLTGVQRERELRELGATAQEAEKQAELEEEGRGPTAPWYVHPWAETAGRGIGRGIRGIGRGAGLVGREIGGAYSTAYPPYSRRGKAAGEEYKKRQREWVEKLGQEPTPAEPLYPNFEMPIVRWFRGGKKEDERFGPITREERAAARRELEKRDFERWKKGF